MLLELCLLKILYIFSITNECSGRIINGTEAASYDLSYIVSIRLRYMEALWFGNGHNCGGTLIKPNVVLSAAHCFTNFDDHTINPPNIYIVVMGSRNRLMREKYTMIFDIEKIISYPKKFRTHKDGDIALAILRGWVPSDHPIMQPISINRKTMPGNTMCVVSGWGVTNEVEYLRADTLLSANVPIIDFDVCTTKAGYNKRYIGTGYLCAGYLKGQIDGCNGDSGGPLVCNARLTGVVSFAFGCALPRFPGVYTDVAFYSSWIDKHLNPQPEEMIIANNTNRLEDHLIVFLIVNIAFKTHAVLFRKRYHIFTF